MRAAVYRGAGAITIEDRPRPEPGPGEALLRVGAVGICGTDLRVYASGHQHIPPSTPRILGHEVAGDIVEVGEGVSSLEVGMRVGIAPNIGCGLCPQCVSGWNNLCPDYEAFGISLDGGFAEYMLIPAAAIRQGNVVPISDRMSYASATLAEPLSCCLNGQEAVTVGPDDVVLVIGAGPIGVMHVLLAANVAGARTVIVSGWPEARLEQARKQGADMVINPKEQDLKAAVVEATDREGASVVIVATSSARAQEDALQLAAPRGRINLFAGLADAEADGRIDPQLIHYKQLVVTGTTGSNPRQYRSTIELITAGRLRVDGLVSATLPLSRFQEGIERAQAKNEMRIILEPSA